MINIYYHFKLYIEGRNAVLESLRSDRKFKRLLVQDGIKKDEKVRQIMSKATNRNVFTKYVPKSILDKMSVTGVHQGFIALVRDKEEYKFDEYIDSLFDDGIDPFFVFIRDAQYSHNIGAIIRTAECVGSNGVLVPPKVDINADVIRASTGAAEHVEIFHESLFSAIKTCKTKGIKIIGIEVSGEKFYYESDLLGPAMFIIGGEDKPLSMEIIKKCDIIVKIPLLGRVNSLNMSVAASIILYEKLRQEVI